MKGWLLMDPPAIATPARLKTWLKVSRSFVATLPRK